MDSMNDREAIIARIAGSEEEIAALHEHVQEITEGKAFRGSDRCGRFLAYIIGQAIAGRFEALKERVIGIEVFGRSPSYDTSEDAIVRVTASDVRKRLLQHYGRNGTASKFHISLPVGSYVPEIIREAQSSTERLEASPPRPAAPVTPPAFSVMDKAFEPTSAQSPASSPAAASIPAVPSAETALSTWRMIAILLGGVVILLAALNCAQWASLRKTTSRLQATPVSLLPWSVLFNSPHPTHLITSDIDIVKLQRLTGSRISVSDYANHNYVPEQTALTSEDKLFWLPWMQGNKSAILDTQITADIAELAGVSARTVDVEGARDIKFSDLRTDDNFIFLGSPYSNPWFSVFNDELDFRFIPSAGTGLGPEVIGDVHPESNEQSIYTPTARGGATGESYAIVAFVGNPNQYGQVLLLAGISGEGTVAAGKLVTDLPRLSSELQKCGVSSHGPLKHFEMLLSVKTMAGSPSQYGVVACHILPGAAR